MFRKTFLFPACLLLAACGPGGEKGDWQASVERTNAPPLGMELIRDSHGLSGAVYIMNPNKPGDFAGAQKYPIQIQQQKPDSIFFIVFFAPHEPDRVTLKLKGPIAGPEFHGVMQSADGRGDPIDFDFTRVK